jgi:diguanylate cyclase (GGDEF)-like protein
MIYGTFWVYRIGGDEFVVILEGTSYKERNELFKKVQTTFAESADNNAVSPQSRYSASCGMAEYSPETDDNFEAVFRRADNDMYENKKRFKEKHGSYR